jgi:hypothetical protein
LAFVHRLDVDLDGGKRVIGPMVDRGALEAPLAH